MNALGSHIVYNHADFRLLSRRALLALLSYPERNLFLRGMVPMLGFNEQTEYYDRLERQAGETKYPLSRMIALAMDGITSLSAKPLHWIGMAGGFSILVAIGVIIWALMRHKMGLVITGWTSLLVSVWLVGGLLLMSMQYGGAYEQSGAFVVLLLGALAPLADQLTGQADAWIQQRKQRKGGEPHGKKPHRKEKGSTETA